MACRGQPWSSRQGSVIRPSPWSRGSTTSLAHGPPPTGETAGVSGLRPTDPRRRVAGGGDPCCPAVSRSARTRACGRVWRRRPRAGPSGARWPPASRARRARVAGRGVQEVSLELLGLTSARLEVLAGRLGELVFHAPTLARRGPLRPGCLAVPRIPGHHGAVHPATPGAWRSS